MANFNFGCDCSDEAIAEKLMNEIQGTDIYQDGLDIDCKRVMVISKQGLLPIIESFANLNKTKISIEVYPEDMEYDKAEESGNIEYFEYGDSPRGVE